MTTYPNALGSKRSIAEPPTQYELVTQYELAAARTAGGQHSTPLPTKGTRKRKITPKRKPTSRVHCYHCGHLALSSPCRDCLAKDPEPTPAPAQPETLDLGPLPDPESGRMCPRCYKWPDACRCWDSQDIDPEPLPEAWASYSPDMSCYVTTPQPQTAGEIECRTLLELLQLQPPTRDGGAVVYHFGGHLPPAAQDAIASYMERIHSRLHEQPGAVMYVYSGADIYLTVYLPSRPGGVSLISLWDYGVPAPPPPPPPACEVLPSYVQQIGGVA